MSEVSWATLLVPDDTSPPRRATAENLKNFWDKTLWKFFTKILGLVWIRHEWECQSGNTRRKAARTRCAWHIVQRDTKSISSVPSQGQQEYQGMVYTKAKTKLKPLSECKKRRIDALNNLKMCLFLLYNFLLLIIVIIIINFSIISCIPASCTLVKRNPFFFRLVW